MSPSTGHYYAAIIVALLLMNLGLSLPGVLLGTATSAAWGVFADWDRVSQEWRELRDAEGKQS